MVEEFKIAYDRVSYPAEMWAIASWLVGPPTKKAHELLARQMLDRMFRSAPWDPAICLMLADAISPDSESNWQLCLRRKRGRKRRVNQQQVAFFIWHRMQQGLQWEAAVAEAKDTFKVRSRSTITRAWQKWRQHFEGEATASTATAKAARISKQQSA